MPFVSELQSASEFLVLNTYYSVSINLWQTTLANAGDFVPGSCTSIDSCKWKWKAIVQFSHLLHCSWLVLTTDIFVDCMGIIIKATKCSFISLFYSLATYCLQTATSLVAYVCNTATASQRCKPVSKTWHENDSNMLISSFYGVQGRSRSSMLVPLESPSAVLVMISSKSASICNRFHARWANSGKITISKGGTPLWCPRSRGTLSPSGTKLPHKKLETLGYHMVKTRSLWSGLGIPPGRDRQTDGQTDRQMDRQNSHS